MMLPFVQNSIHGEGTLAVPVVLYGNRNFDDGLMELKQVMTANGFLPIAGAAIVGEHSFSKILGAGRPDGEDMALVDQLARQTAEKVKGLTALPEEPVQVEGWRPHPPLLHPPRPERRAHQGLPEGQARHRPGQVRSVRPVRPAVPHGGHRSQ